MHCNKVQTKNLYIFGSVKREFHVFNDQCDPNL